MADIKNINAGTAVVSVIADNRQLSRALEDNQGALQRFADVCTQIGLKMHGLGQLYMMPIARANEAYVGFQTEMLRVGAVTSSTGDQMAALTEKARELGIVSGFSATQVAAVMGNLGMMGFDNSQIKDTTKDILALSRVCSTDAAEAATIAANAMKTFGLEISDISHVGDVLAATANGSAQNLTDLGEALKMAGPIARMSGASLEEVAAALGVMANMGIRGSMAGTALAKSYKQLADPKVQEYLRTLGVSATDSRGNLRNMATVLAEIGRAISGMGSGAQLNAIKEIFGDRGALGGGVLAYNVGQMDNLNEKLSQLDGYLGRANQTMSSGWKSAVSGFNASVQDLLISAGQALEVFTPVVKAVSSIIQAISNCGIVMKTTVPVVAAVGVTLVTLGTAFTALGLTIKAVLTVKSTWLSLLGKSIPAQTASIVATKRETTEVERNSAAWIANAIARKTARMAGAAGAGAAGAAGAGAAGATGAAGAVTVGAIAAIGVAVIGVIGGIMSALSATGVDPAAYDDEIAKARKARQENLAEAKSDLEQQKAIRRSQQEILSERQKLLGDLRKLNENAAGWNWTGWKNFFTGHWGTSNTQSLADEIQKRLDDLNKEEDALKKLSDDKRKAAVAAYQRSVDARAQMSSVIGSLDRKEESSNARELRELDEMQQKFNELAKTARISGRDRRTVAEGNDRFNERRAEILDRQLSDAGGIDVGADMARRNALRQESAQRKQLETELSELRENDMAAYQSRLQQLIAQSKTAVQAAAGRLQAVQATAQGSGGEEGAAISESERRLIEEAKKTYETAQAGLDEWQGRFTDSVADFETNAMKSLGDTISGFSIGALRSLVGYGTGSKYQDKMSRFADASLKKQSTIAAALAGGIQPRFS